MNKSEFNANLKKLTRTQHEVLDEILAGKSVKQIAEERYCTQCNVSRHLSNICKTFGFKNDPGDSFSYKWDLIDVFVQHSPESVNAGLDNRLLRVKPECPEGQVPLDSRFYVERGIEARCVETLTQPGALLRIKGPRQIGKSSLMARTLSTVAAKEQAATVVIDLRSIEEAVMQSLEKFLQNFCAQITRQLGLPNKVLEYWDLEASPSLNMTCSNYLIDCVLPNIDGCLVLGVDDLDRVFAYREVADGFLRLLRSLHEAAKTKDFGGEQELWQKLRLVLAYSTEEYARIDDINQSPFNVGVVIQLEELSATQIEALAKLHGLAGRNPQDASGLEVLRQMVGGHPFLVRLALYNWAMEARPAKLLAEAPTNAGIYAEHLRRHWQVLSENTGLAAAMQQVVAAEQPVELSPGAQFKLESMGLIHQEVAGATPRCQLYRTYFQQVL